MKSVAVVVAAWLVVGLVLFGVNATCSGDQCSDGAWYASVLGLIAWGIVGVPIVLGAAFIVIDRLLRKVPR